MKAKAVLRRVMPPAWGPPDELGEAGGPPPAARPEMAGPAGPPPGAEAMDQADRVAKGELSTEELRSKVKKARWNVFMYLGIAAIMFSFALIPLPVPAPWDDETVLTDDVSGGELQRELPYLFGMPIDGKDSTDIRLVIEVVPMDGGDFSVHVIEAHCGTDKVTDEMLEFEAAVARNESYSDNHILFEGSQPKGTYEFEFRLDPGGYCLLVEYEDYGHDQGSLEVTASVYGLREIGGGLGGISLLWAIFAFIGAQRKGKILKERTSVRRGSMSIEDSVMHDTNQAVIGAGPAGPPPADGPAGPPPATAPGPTAAPAPGPTAAPAQAASPYAAAPTAPVAPAAPTTALNYIESGDGYHYILKADNTFDPQPYIKNADGTYTPFNG